MGKNITSQHNCDLVYHFMICVESMERLSKQGNQHCKKNKLLGR